MAITITPPIKPDHWLPSANPIIYSISTTTINARLSYIIDVYINGSQAVQMKYSVYDRSNMNIDLSRVVNDYLSENFVNDLTVNSGHFHFNPTETCSLSIKVTEEYWNGTQMVLDTPNAVLVKEIYIWLAGANFQQSRDLTKFEHLFKWNIPVNNEHPKFMGAKNDAFIAGIHEVEKITYLAQPQAFQAAYKIDMNTPRTIGFFTFGYSNPPGDIADRYYVWVYNSKFQRTKEYVFINPDSSALGTNSYSNGIAQMPCSPYNINQMVSNNEWSAINLTTYGSTQYIDPNKDDDKYYVVFTHEGWGIGMGYEWGYRAVPFEIVPCTHYQVYNILYKTLEGSWWQIRTEMKNHQETDVKRSVMYNTWGLRAGEVLPNSKTFKRVMHVEGNGTITLNTDWIGNQGVIEEIEEMLVSPDIYLVTNTELGEVVYIPVVLKDQSYQIYNKKQDKLFQYEFEFEEAYKKTTLI